MFGFFNFNILYPAEKFLTSVLKMLKFNPSTYNIGELVDQMNEKEQCELLNGSLDVNALNEKLKLKNFYIGKALIKKSTFVFKKTYMTDKTILSFEDIEIDIMNKIKNEQGEGEAEVNQIKSEEKSGGGLLDNLINMVIHNLEINFKNIKIRFFDKENKNIEYSFFIKSVEFKEAKNIQPIQSNEKIKYLFIHNKALYIAGILFKEKYDNNDEIFFSDKEEDDEKKNLFISNNNNLLYIKNKIEIDMFHDKDNFILTIGNNNDLSSDFYIENIFTIQQLNSLYNYFMPKKEDKIINNENNNNINDVNNINNNNIDNINKDNNDINTNVEINNESNKKEEKKGFDLMGYKIEKINLDMKLGLLYFIFFENGNNNNNDVESIKKDWVSHKDNLIKKEDTDVSKTLIEHFNNFQKNYYIFLIDNVLYNSKNGQTSINEIALKYIEQKNIKNNIQNDNDNDNIIILDKNGYESKNIIDINKFNFNMESKELSYDTIYIEISPNFVYFLKHFKECLSTKKPKNIHLNQKIDNDKPKIEEKSDNQNENIINTNDVKKEEENNIIMVDDIDNNVDNERKKLFTINGKDLNIKIYIDKNIDENIINTISLNDLFTNNKEENDYICFNVSNLNIKNEETIPILYDVISLNYYTTDSNTYPLLKLVENKNNPEYKDSNILNKPNELSVDLQFQIILFINTGITKKILDYINFIFKKKQANQIMNGDVISYENYDANANNNIGCCMDNKCNKKCSMGLKIKEIKIYLMNEEDTLLNIDDLLSDLPENNMQYNKNHNYICVNLNEFSTKFECNGDNMKFNLYLKSLIIKDNIKKSKYKILFSNYNFKNKDEVFINCDFDICKKKDINKLEINPTINICPIAIYLDQKALYYLFNIYNGIKCKKENENENVKVPKNNIDNNINKNKVENNDKNNEMKNKNDYIIINNTIINSFFLELNYNTNDVDDIEFLQKKIVILLNNISLTNIQIDFKKYKNENNGLSLHDAIKKIYEFYYNDLVNVQGLLPVVSALPIINYFSSIADGMLNIVREPINNYQKNESVVDGFVNGVSSCVVNTTTIFTHLGEKISSYFNFLGCTGRDEEDELNDNTCRRIRHMINPKNRDIEKYYFK